MLSSLYEQQNSSDGGFALPDTSLMSLSSEEKRMEAAEAALNEMERIAAHMRAIIVRMPPHDLLGYIYGQRLTAIGSKDHERAEGDPTEGQKNAINESQFLLEYVHAVLASDESPDDAKFDEAQCIELYELSRILKEQAMIY